jgi:hypothetical protein
MAYSYYNYTGDGTTTQFPVAFPYIRREHVLAAVAGSPATFTFVNSSTIQMDVAPANGAVVRVYRQTPLTAPLVDFTDGATLVAADLDTNAKQSIYTQQELSDSQEEGLANVIPNGDKGDITTSAGGTVWTVNAGLSATKSSFTQAGTGAVARTVDSKLKDVVSVKDFGAACDGTTDDTVAAQAAVTYCNTNNKDLEIPGLCLLTGSVNIDRMVDGAAYDHYFTIFSSNGGGFVVASDMTMFSTTLVNPSGAALPVTQMVRFSGIKFEADVNTRTAYVLDGNKFLRTTFNGCSFRKIRCLATGGSTYVQSIYFVSCQARRWAGVFFECTGAASYDIKAHSCLMEAGVIAFQLNKAVGCSFQQNCIEGMSAGYALILNGAQGVSISGNYFEGNAVDIFFNGGNDIRGVSLAGNFFAATASPGGYNVFWGVNTFDCVSTGNYSTERLHYLETTSQIFISDHALIAVTNLASRAYFPSKTTAAGDLAIGLAVPTDRGHFHKASNCRIFLSDDVINDTYGGFFTGYGVSGQGGHAAIGTSEAGTKTNILTVNYAKEVYPSTDNVSSLGVAGNRWTTVYATTGTINTSDANQKQQIEELSEAEHAVATTIKGLIRKFKFNDAVEAKGDDARIHVGVIAQDVEQAFIDKGLDPADYALFCRDEWWELDGQTVSGDTPGATRRERLGIRYEELLAFIISVL